MACVCAIGKIKKAEKVWLIKNCHRGTETQSRIPLALWLGASVATSLLQRNRYGISREHVAVTVIDLEGDGKIAAGQIDGQFEIELI
jgi:hypothetical protein